jgi:hypothetical protein
MLRSRVAFAAARRIALSGLTSAPWHWLRQARLPPALLRSRGTLDAENHYTAIKQWCKWIMMGLRVTRFVDRVGGRAGGRSGDGETCVPNVAAIVPHAACVQCEFEYVLGHEAARICLAVMPVEERRPQPKGQLSHDGIRTVLTVSASQRPAGVGEPGLPATHRVCTAPSPFHPPYQPKNRPLDPRSESSRVGHYPP